MTKLSGFALILALMTIQMTLTVAHAQSAPSLSDLANYTGLHKAAHENDMDQLLMSIKANVDLEARDESARTPIIVAAFASNDRIVEALAKAGANLNALEHQAYDIVTIAAVANDLELLDLALNLGANAGNITSVYDGTALIAAAHLGHYRVVDRLVQNKAPLDHINNLQWTALIEAVILGDGGFNHTETVRILLAAGADQHIADGQGITPLQHAQSRDYNEMVKLFTNANDTQ